MYSQQHLEQMKQIKMSWLAKLHEVRAEIMAAARRMLEEDIEDPDLNGPDLHPDAFMLRANQIGIALFEMGFYSVAESLYRGVLKKTLKYREETGKRRHVGALNANVAAACVLQGNLGEAIIRLLKAAQDDVEVYGVAKHESFAITGLLQEYFGKPVRNEALRVVQAVDPTVTIADVEAVGSLLGDREYAFLAYARLALLHEAANRRFPNEFSQLQVFGALRALSSVLEVELKTIAGNMQGTLFPTMMALYESKGWWQAFQTKRSAIGATRNSNRPVDDQLRDAIAIAPTDDDSRFWKSLLIAHIVRNYTTHQLETQCALVQSYSQEALACILHVMMTASKHT